MASLLVNLLEVVESYIKNAKDKDIAGKIGSEVLERSRQVIKKYKFTPEDACIFHVAELYPMLSRELIASFAKNYSQTNENFHCIISPMVYTNRTKYAERIV